MIDKMYKLRPGESDVSLCYRIYKDKEDGLNNLNSQEIADIINYLTGNDYGESKYRKHYAYFKEMYEAIFEGESSAPSVYEPDQEFDKEQRDRLLEFMSLEEDDQKYAIMLQQENELKRIKIKIEDRKRVLNKNLRKESRIEDLISAVKADAKSFEYIPLKSGPSIKFTGNKTAILLIGDWHIGNETHNFMNNYNLEIAVKRIERLQAQALKYCQVHGIKTLHVLGLGDFIQGNIHLNGRIDAEFDVVTQVKQVSRLIYSLLVNLSLKVEKVTYRQVLDNHSRVTKDYKEHLERESFASLIGFWVKDRLEDSPYPIEYIDDNIDPNIGRVIVNGEEYYFVHGHLDRSKKSFSSLFVGLKGKVAGMFLGHYHVDKKEDYQGIKVYYNGSLMGPDEYALSKRLFGKPSQSMFVFDDDNIIEISINLDI